MESESSDISDAGELSVDGESSAEDSPPDVDGRALTISEQPSPEEVDGEPPAAEIAAQAVDGEPPADAVDGEPPADEPPADVVDGSPSADAVDGEPSADELSADGVDGDHTEAHNLIIPKELSFESLEEIKNYYVEVSQALQVQEWGESFRSFLEEKLDALQNAIESYADPSIETDGSADMNADSAPADSAIGQETDTPTETDGSADMNADSSPADSAIGQEADGNAYDADQSMDFVQQTEHQSTQAVESLQQVEGIQPEVWQQLEPGERLEVLQDIENRMAQIQGRNPVEVNIQNLDQNVFGGYDGQGIIINENHLQGNDLPVEEYVDTIVHEGRHAYQDHVVRNPDALSDSSVIEAWTENMKPENYLNAEQYGQEMYESQPIEADAWSYAQGITSRLFNK